MIAQRTKVRIELCGNNDLDSHDDAITPRAAPGSKGVRLLVR